MAVYSFDLSDYESGQFAATRFPDDYAVSGDWVCRADTDAEALTLAHEAAETELAAPEDRAPHDFDVTFVNSIPAAAAILGRKGGSVLQWGRGLMTAET